MSEQISILEALEITTEAIKAWTLEQTGDIDSLLTTDKTNIVAAINELSKGRHIYVCDDEPTDVSDGDIWLDTDEHITVGDQIYVCDDEPVDAADNTLWVDTDEEYIVSGESVPSAEGVLF